ncbi:SMP-30/gluconolactonase/LRE family protein [Xinfangfangia pollutisoli]|uniref:SMP-30/gluconolactonase/LRE family protein n=1 Tax=Xinfangfangia pollutisoli TaxID=2865960 RepID=UPI001CD6C27B|nr:SMP-30/gluconolactonase/LRE family protein [Xinfangfangia pollutisoli]
MTISITCVDAARAELGEGTIWDPAAQVLWWIDIYGPRIHRFDPAQGTSQSWPAPQHLGCIGLRASGGLVVTMASGFHFFDPATGLFTAIADPEADLPLTRFNDGKTDRFGHFWSGSMFEAPGQAPQRIGALYRLSRAGQITRMVEGIGCSNGLAWSPDGRLMYFTDSHTHLVWAFDYDPEAGRLDNRRVYLDLTARGDVVDGATVDAAGNYWLTVPFKGKVLAFDPAGRQIAEIDLPCDLPTCCEFGGRDLETLFVTTARYRRSDAELAGQTAPGGLFAITGLGTRGLVLPPYAG